jgi:hypothetical protein
MQKPEPHINRVPIGSARTFTAVETIPGEIRPYMSAMVERSKTFLTQEFKGITVDGQIEDGLFHLAPTGISLRSVLDAANAFADSLDETQRRAASFDIGSDAWRKWHNMHLFFFRHGLFLNDVSARQRDLALELVRATLSAAGFENARNVMKLNEHVRELTGRDEEYGEWYYFMSIFGQPSATEPWGWQLDGHHLIVNCFVLGDRLVLTPHFSGSEPVVANSGVYAGTHVFEAEQSAGLALMNALSPAQQERARIGTTLPRELLTIAQVDNLELPYAGIGWSELAPAQRDLLLALLAVYVGRIRPGHAEIRMDEVGAHLVDTHFGWMGPCDDSSPFYYRVHSPVILIEFDHLPGIVYEQAEPSRAHVHTIVRTPNGNDYGRDLLRQHYAQHDHSHPATAHRRGDDFTG